MGKTYRDDKNWMTFHEKFRHFMNKESRYARKKQRKAARHHQHARLHEIELGLLDPDDEVIEEPPHTEGHMTW